MDAQIVQFVGWGLIAFTFILALIGALKGRSRGIARQIVRTVTVIASLFISIYLARLISSALMVALDGMTTEDLLLSLENTLSSLGMEVSGNLIFSLLSYVETSTMNYVLAIPLSLIVTPILFVLIFMIVSGLMLILHAILSGIFGFSKKRNNFVTRLLGLLLGAIQGVAVAAIVLVPVVGILTTSTDVVEKMNAEAPGEETTVTITEAYEEYIMPFAEDRTISFMGTCGDKLLYRVLSTVDLYGEKYNMTETVSTPAIKGYAASTGLSGADWMSLTSENKESINAILEALDDSPYVTALVSDILASAARAYNDGAFEFTAEGEVATLLGAVVEVFDGIDSETLMPTLKTISEAYYILSDEGVLTALSEGNTTALTDMLSEKDAAGRTVVNKLINKLNSNMRTAKLVTAITKLTVTVMADSFGGGGIITEEAYDNIKGGINETLQIDKESFDTEEEYVEAIADSLDSTLVEVGINLDKEVVDVMAQHVADNYSDVDALTDHQMNDIILSYYNAYLETGEIPIP